MDAHTQIPSRLRLHRTSFSFAAATLDENDSHLARDLYEEEDNRSTPRLNGISKMSVDSYEDQSDFGESARAQSTPALSREETPAARLRALLARVPSSATPKATARPRSPSLSGLESDFATDLDASVGNASYTSEKPTTPYPQHVYSPSPPASVAHNNVRDIFSKALQDLATPEKPKRARRSSVGSAAQGSPVRAIGSYSRSKRVSFSDDEVEKLTKSEISDKSFESSHAAAYDILRERLTQNDIGASTSTIDESVARQRVKQAPLGTSTPPSTSRLPLAQSLSQFPSQYLNSDLMNDDSDMKRIIHDLETDTASEGHATDEGGAGKAGPSTQTKRRSLFSREPALSRPSSSESMSLTHSRPGSSQSVRSQEDATNDQKGWNRPLSAYMDRHHANSTKHLPFTNGFSHRRQARDELSALSDSSQTDRGPSKNGVALYEATSYQTSPARTHRRNHAPTADVRNDSRQSGGSSEAQSLRLSTGSNETQKADGRSREDSLTARPNPRSAAGLTQAHSVSAMSLLNDQVYGGRGRSRSPPESPSCPPSRSPSRDEERREHALERNSNSPHPDRSDIRHSHANNHSTRDPEVTQHSDAHMLNSQEQSSRSIASTSKLSIARDPSSSKPINSMRRRREGKGERSSVSMTHDSDPDHGNSNTESPSFSSQHVPPKTVLSTSPKGSPDRINDRSPTPSSHNWTERRDPSGTNGWRIPDLPSSRANSSGSKRDEQSNRSLSFTSFSTELKRDQTGRPAFVGIDRSRLQRENGFADRRQVRTSVALEPISLHDSDIESFNEDDIAASSPSHIPNGFGSRSEAQSLVHDGHDRGANDLIEEPHNIGNAQANNDHEYHHAFSPPPSPRTQTIPNKPTIITPQRRSRTLSRVEYQTPPRPAGIPSLPEPPTPTDEDVAGDRALPLQVVATPASKNYADAKTPRPPGAWATPFSAPSTSKTPPALPPAPNFNDSEAVIDRNGIYTPPASFSKASTLSMKTPAPPGAWVATPGTIASKRVQQKVRFNEDETLRTLNSLQDDSSLMEHGPSYIDGSVVTKGIMKDTVFGTQTKASGLLDKGKRFFRPWRVHKDVVSSEDGDGIAMNAAAKRRVNSPSVRRSRIRMLDAMGNEIVEQDVVKEDAPEQTQVKAEEFDSTSLILQAIDSKNLERREALELLHKAITELRDHFNKTDDPLCPRDADAVDAQIADLKARSIRAMEERQRLLSKIQGLEAGDLRSLAVDAASFRHGASPRFSHYKWLWGCLVLQVVLLIFFYRLTSLGARRLFLTTYIDTFYPELYLHTTNPELLQGSNASSVGWGGTPHVWKTMLQWVWNDVVERFYITQETMWEVWRDAPRSMAWPPT